MVLGEFLEEAKGILPPYSNDLDNDHISKITEIYFTRLDNLVKKIDEKELLKLKIEKGLLLSKLSFYMKTILKAIEHFETNPEKCDMSIYDTFFNVENGVKDLFIKPIPAIGPIYRMRCDEDINKLEKSTADDMFHIPFDKLDKTRNQRFSRSGYPFLYAGNSAQICWKELGRPKFTSCHLSILRIERELVLYDLSFPQKIDKKEDILRLPLIIACSIKYSENHEKPEYIIPQAVLKGVMKFNEIDRDELMVWNAIDQSTKIPIIDGILYVSTKVGDEPQSIDENDYCNYVFPTMEQNTSGYCPQLCKKFTISEPVTLRSVFELNKDVSREEMSEYEFISICEKCSPTQLFRKGEEILKSKYVTKTQLCPAT